MSSRENRGGARGVSICGRALHLKDGDALGCHSRMDERDNSSDTTDQNEALLRAQIQPKREVWMEC